jgi:nucleoside-diphosphate-sugar epimerase
VVPRIGEEDHVHVLITGAAGFIGTAVVDALAHGHWLRCADLQPMPEPVCGESVVADLTSYQDCLDIVQDMHAIVHLAVAGGPPVCLTPEKPMAGTVSATANLLEAAQRAGIQRFVLMSSCAVMSGYPRETVIDADMPHRFHGLYALSKSLQERLAEYYASEHGMIIPALRPWSVVDGETRRDKYGRRIQPDDPTAFGFICRHDLARACSLALTAPLAGFQPFHLMATPDGRRMFDADRTEQWLGWHPETTFEDLEAARVD